VLFGALFLIFFFSFTLIKKVFLDSLGAEILQSKNMYQAKYLNVLNEADATVRHFELIVTIPTVLTALFSSYRSSVFAYNCPVVPRRNNYLFIYLEKHYSVLKQNLLAQTRLNIRSGPEKNRFMEKRAHKLF